MMDKNKVLKMIDEYLTEPNSIDPEWIECLLFCRKCINNMEDTDDEKPVF